MAYGFGNTTIRDGLVFYLDAANPSSYKFNGEQYVWQSIAKDSSIGYSPTPPTFNSDIYGKKALSFNSGHNEFYQGQMGNDKLLDVDTTKTITVQVFFNITELQNLKTIFCACANTLDKVQYGIGITNNVANTNIYAQVFNDTTRESFSTDAIIESDRYPYRLLTVSFGVSKQIWFDTKYIADHTITTSNPFGYYWFIATDPSKSTWFNGSINAIRVYDRELTEAEIYKNYQFFIQRT